MNIVFYSADLRERNECFEALRQFAEDKLPQGYVCKCDEYEDVQGFSKKDSWNIICYDTAGLAPEIVREQLTELRETYPDAVIVILAEDESYAVFGYSIRAYEYLICPVTEEELVNSLQSILRERFQDLIQFFSIRIKGAWTKIEIRHVLYLETFNHHIIFYMDNGDQFKKIGNFKDVHVELACNPWLFQCHKSYVVNGSYIESMTQGSFVMQDGKKVSISRPYRKAARKFYARCISQRCE